MKRIIATALAAASFAMATPVDDIGNLQVVGSNVVGSKTGQPAALRGMSFFWSQANVAQGYYNASVLNWLATDWNVNIVRAAMGIEGDWSTTEKSYLSDPAGNKARIKALVDAAIASGVYVIIDWHDHNATSHTSQATAFFQEMATTYGAYPNVIYEIFNEPTGDVNTWTDIKTYATTVINAIRAIDPDNLIVVGTPKYSSEVAYAASHPLTGANMTNIAYTFHFYASEAWHHNTVAQGGGDYRGKADSAMNIYGKAIFVTEWGNSAASGDGALNTTWMDDFMTWMTTKKLSWCNWSLSDKAESSAALTPGSQSGTTWNHVASTSGGWTTGQLTQSGNYVRGKTKSLNAAYVAPGSSGAVSSSAAVSSSTVRSSSSGTPTLANQAQGVFAVRVITNGVELNLDATEGFKTADLLDLFGRPLVSMALQPNQASVHLQSANALHGVVLVRLQGNGSARTMPVTISAH